MSRIVAVLFSLLRLGLASGFFWICYQDWPSVQAREGFKNLPPYNAAAEASELFKQNRLSEALLLVNEALKHDPDNVRLQVIKQGLETERRSLMRMLASGGRGALTGRGDDPASLTGAVVADLFVFGDLRDLVIQSGHWLRDEETDELIVALSAAGISLTAAPSVDLGAALLKLARRMGALSDALAKSIAEAARRAVKQRRTTEFAAITNDIALLSKRAQPAGTVSILKHVDDVAGLRLAARFAETPEGLRALLLDPATTMRWLKSGWRHSEDWLFKAARKGRPGLRYLASNSSAMFKAHPLLGFIKGLWKGNIPDLLWQLGQRYSLLILGFAGGWVAYEALLLLGRLMGGGSASPRPESGLAS